MSEDTEKKVVKVNIDTTPLESRIKAQYEDQLKQKDATIAALLAQEKERLVNEQERKNAEKVSSPRPATEGGTTADYESNWHKVTFPIDIANSDIDPSWIKGKNVEDVLSQTEDLAKMGNVGCQKVLSKLGKRALKSGIDIEFLGESRLLFKHDLPISEFDSTEIKQQKQGYNKKLRDNRVNWRNLIGED